MSDAPDAALSHFEKNWNTHLEDLKHLVRIPSVSFPDFPTTEVIRSAQAVAKLFTERGLENVRVFDKPVSTHPYVYGDWLHAPGKPTLLLYAHHDVQPPLREEVWKTPPFEPTEKEGPGGLRLYGRGAADDKAGIIVHTAAIFSYLKSVQKLPVNVKVIIEGEEEVGSEHLSEFLEQNRKLLSADVLVLTDTANYDVGIPTLTIALRGLVAVEIEVRALKNSIHSGMWGGPVPDPVIALTKILSQLVDDQGQIAIPEIKKMIPPLTRAEELTYSKVPVDEARFREQAGMVPSAQFTRSGPLLPLQLWRFPSISVNAIQASSRKQAGNIINDAAWAKVGVRVAPGMDPQAVQRAFVDFLRSKVPWGLEVDIRSDTAAGGWFTKAEGPAFDAANRALEMGYGRAPIHFGCGGTIPFVQPFAEALGGAPALLVGVEDPYTNAHGENESLLISDLKKACKSQIYLFDQIAKLVKPNQ